MGFDGDSAHCGIRVDTSSCSAPCRLVDYRVEILMHIRSNILRSCGTLVSSLAMVGGRPVLVRPVFHRDALHTWLVSQK